MIIAVQKQILPKVLALAAVCFLSIFLPINSVIAAIDNQTSGEIMMPQVTAEDLSVESSLAGGSNIPFSFTVNNVENRGFFDIGYRVYLLNSRKYIFFQKDFPRLLNLTPLEKRNIESSFDLPKSIPSGDYLLQVEVISPSGADLGAIQAKVNVSGAEVSIVTFGKVSLSAGDQKSSDTREIVANLGDEIIAHMMVNSKKALKVKEQYKIYPEEDFSQGDVLEGKERLIRAGVGKYDFSVKSPEKGGNFTVAYWLVDVDGQQVSVVKQFTWRVWGGSPSLNYLAVDKTSAKKGESVDVEVALIPPVAKENIGEVIVKVWVGDSFAQKTLDFSKSEVVLVPVTLIKNLDVLAVRVVVEKDGKSILDYQTSADSMAKNNQNGNTGASKNKNVLYFWLVVLLVDVLFLYLLFIKSKRNAAKNAIMVPIILIAVIGLLLTVFVFSPKTNPKKQSANSLANPISFSQVGKTGGIGGDVLGCTLNGSTHTCDYTIVTSKDDGKTVRSSIDGFDQYESDIPDNPQGTYYDCSLGDLRENWFRFSNIDIPKNANITDAKITFTPFNWNGVPDQNDDAFIAGDFKTVFKAELSTDAGQITDDGVGPSYGPSTNFYDRVAHPLGTVSVSWNDIGVWSPVPGPGGATTSPDIKTLIQEVVNQGGWSASSANLKHIGIFWLDNGTNRSCPNGVGRGRQAVSFDGQGQNFSGQGVLGPAPKLTVSWQMQLPTVTLTATPTLVNYGAAATLTWTIANATSCTGTNMPAGNWSTGTSDAVGVTTGSLIIDKTYTLNCTGPGGSASSTVTVNVRPSAPIPHGCQADFNANGIVDSADQTILAANFASPGNARYDLNDDGNVNSNDQLIINKLIAWNYPCAVPAPLPPTPPACTSSNFGSALNFYWAWSGSGLQSFDIRVSATTSYTVLASKNVSGGFLETTGASGWSGSLTSGDALSLAPNTLYYWSVRTVSVNGTSAYSFNAKFPASPSCTDFDIGISSVTWPARSNFDLGESVTLTVNVKNFSLGTAPNTVLYFFPSGTTLPNCKNLPDGTLNPTSVGISTPPQDAARVNQSYPVNALASGATVPITVNFKVSTSVFSGVAYAYVVPSCTFSPSVGYDPLFNNNISSGFTYSVAANGFFETRGGDVGSAGTGAGDNISVNFDSSTINPTHLYQSDYVIAAKNIGTNVNSRNWEMRNYEARQVPSGGVYDYFYGRFHQSAQATCDFVSSKPISNCGNNFTYISSGPGRKDPPTVDTIVFVDGPNGIDGDLIIKDNLILTGDTTLIFVVSRNIIVDKSVTRIDGIFVSKGSFSDTNYAATPDGGIGQTGLLTVNGAVFVDAVGGALNLRRYFTGPYNNTTPSVKFVFDPKYMVKPNLVNLIGVNSIKWTEVNP